MRRHAAIAVVAGLVLVCAGTADAYVYWANRDSASIGRARSNGKGIDQTYIKTRSAVYGVAVDEDYVYWSDRKKGRIGRARRDGSGIDRNFVVGLGSPHSIAVDSDHIYWTDSQTNTIGRADLDGGNVDPDFIADSASGVAVDAHNVYWSNSSGVGRASLDGTGVDQTFVDTLAYGVDVDSHHIYWAYFRYNPKIRGGVGRAKSSGAAVEKRFVSVRKIYPHDVAVDDAHVWWVQQTGIGRSKLSGRKVKPYFIKGPRVGHGDVGIADMAVDADGTPPATKIKQGPPRRTRSSTARFEFASSERGSTFVCKLDKQGWKHCGASYELRHLDPGEHEFQVRATDRFGNTDPTPAKDRFRVV